MSDFLGRFPFFNISDWLGWSPDWKMPPQCPSYRMDDWSASGNPYRRLLPVCVQRNSAATAGSASSVLCSLASAIIWILLDGSARRDQAIERRALDGRANELIFRAIAQGTALACLNGWPATRSRRPAKRRCSQRLKPPPPPCPSFQRNSHCWPCRRVRASRFELHGSMRSCATPPSSIGTASSRMCSRHARAALPTSADVRAVQ